MTLIPFMVLWMLLAVTVLVLIVKRKLVASHEDDSLHVLASSTGSVTEQVSVATKLEVIDKWGKILTVITVVFGLLLGAAYIYQNWVLASTVQSGV